MFEVLGSSSLESWNYKIAYLSLSTNIHLTISGPTKKVIPVKPNGGYLDSGSVGMDPIVEDFSGRWRSVWHVVEEIKYPKNRSVKETKQRLKQNQKEKGDRQQQGYRTLAIDGSEWPEKAWMVLRTWSAGGGGFNFGSIPQKLVLALDGKASTNRASTTSTNKGSRISWAVSGRDSTIWRQRHTSQRWRQI